MEHLDESSSVTTDSIGNVYIGGRTVSGAFVKKLDSHGFSLWAKQFGTNSGTGSTSLDVDEFDNVYISGYTSERIGDSNLGGTDAFLVKLDSLGNELCGATAWQGRT